MLAGIAALVGVAAACQPLPPPPPPPPPAPTTCDAAVTPTEQSPVTFAAVVAPHDGSPHEVTAFTATSTSEKDAKVAELEQSSTVLAVAPNRPVHVADAPIATGSYADYPQQWGLQTNPPGADFAPAWNTSRFSGHGVTVAVVDTGVDLSHTGLAGHVVAGPDFTVAGNPPVTGDGYGHGTHVAGIIAANDSPSGGLGGAPGATILAVRVLDQNGSGTSVSVAQGVEWAAQHGANVINLSLGAPTCDPVMGQAVTDAHNEGVVVAAAAGNGSTSALFSPAGYSNEVIAVAATDQTGQKASFSNFGAYVGIAAPGVNVLSTCAYTPVCIPSPPKTPSDTFYGYLSGTSMATPFVSAAAALVKEECPSFGPDQIKAELVNHGGAAVPGFSFPSLDAGHAVAADCS